MNFLEEKILADGVIKPGNILKVDNFLNHQIDIDIMRQIAYEFKRRFRGKLVPGILTIEASGIAIATMLLAACAKENTVTGPQIEPPLRYFLGGIGADLQLEFPTGQGCRSIYIR